TQMLAVHTGHAQIDHLVAGVDAVVLVVLGADSDLERYKPRIEEIRGVQPRLLLIQPGKVITQLGHGLRRRAAGAGNLFPDLDRTSGEPAGEVFPDEHGQAAGGHQSLTSEAPAAAVAPPGRRCAGCRRPATWATATRSGGPRSAPSHRRCE